MLTFVPMRRVMPASFSNWPIQPPRHKFFDLSGWMGQLLNAVAHYTTQMRTPVSNS